jgi:hypothetical protein
MHKPKKLPHDQDMCPKNVNCSAKATEVIWTEKMTQNMYCTYMILSAMMICPPRKCWYIPGKKEYLQEQEVKPDNGFLPIEHPSIIWLANKGHGVWGFASSIWHKRRKMSNREQNWMPNKWSKIYCLSDCGKNPRNMEQAKDTDQAKEVQKKDMLSPSYATWLVDVGRFFLQSTHLPYILRKMELD